MFSEPAIGEKFFGRDEILEVLNKRVMALKDGYRQNVALTGQSLSGKSSIILHFLRNLREDGFIPVYVEVSKEPFRAFCDKFIATMLYNALTLKGESVNTEFAGLMEMTSLSLPKTYSAIKLVYSTIEKEGPDQAYTRLLELTQVLRQEFGFPCIVILDEFDNLERLGIKNPFVAFGKIIMVQKDTMYIVSSSRSLAIRKIISEKLSLLFGNFEVLRVENFGVRASNEFINTRLPGFDIDVPLRKFLIAFTDGNPFYLNKIILRIKDIAIERMTSCIDGGIAAMALLDMVYNSSGTIHQYLMNYILELIDLKYRDLYVSILVSIAGGRNRSSEIAKSMHITQTATIEALQRLSEQGLVARNGIFYSIEDVMLGFWLTHVYDRKRKLLVNGVFDKTALWLDEIRACIGSFERESVTPMIEKLAGLFSIFSNEMVCLGAKNSRLPHFTKVEVRSFADQSPFISASFRGNHWIIQLYERDVNESDVVTFIRNVKGLNSKVSNKLMVTAKAMDENAKLLAKELRISIWDSRTFNSLLTLYHKNRVIAL